MKVLLHNVNWCDLICDSNSGDNNRKIYRGHLMRAKRRNNEGEKTQLSFFLFFKLAQANDKM